jgi:hypothetical protein
MGRPLHSAKILFITSFLKGPCFLLGSTGANLSKNTRIFQICVRVLFDRNTSKSSVKMLLLWERLSAAIIAYTIKDQSRLEAAPIY